MIALTMVLIVCRLIRRYVWSVSVGYSQSWGVSVPSCLCRCPVHLLATTNGGRIPFEFICIDGV